MIKRNESSLDIMQDSRLIIFFTEFQYVVLSIKYYGKKKFSLRETIKINGDEQKVDARIDSIIKLDLIQ